MVGYGYATQVADDDSSAVVTPAASRGDEWLLTKFSRILALAVGKKLWAKPAPAPVDFGEVIERIKQAEPEGEKKGSVRVRHAQDAANR